MRRVAVTMTAADAGHAAVCGGHGMAEERRVSFAEHLDRLILTTYPNDRGPYTLEEVAAGLRQVGGPSVSRPYLQQLRRGSRENPSFALVVALALFFRVPLAYFAPMTEGALTAQEAELLTAARNPELNDLIVRLNRLDPDVRHLVATLVDNLLVRGPAHPSVGPSPQT